MQEERRFLFTVIPQENCLSQQALKQKLLGVAGITQADVSPTEGRVYLQAHSLTHQALAQLLEQSGYRVDSAQPL